MAGKRTDYISWDALIISMAMEASWRSKDPRTQNGACVVTPDHKHFAIGYNGFPKLKNKDNDEIFPWVGEGESAMTERYNFAIHAERNALDNAKFDTDGCSLYLFSERGYYPCEICAQGILNKGIVEVVMAFAAEGDSFGASQRYGNQAFDATMKMFDAAGIRVRILGPKMVDHCLDMARRFGKVAEFLQTMYSEGNKS